MRRVQARVAAACLAVGLAAGVEAAVPTLTECLEGSDFVANAARSRDNGMPRASFLDRLEEDLVAIRAFPPALRWFARDEGDEQFLIAAVTRVFDLPQAPERHQEEFFAACLDRALA